jgi:Domain of unknown function (DUF4189)
MKRKVDMIGRAWLNQRRVADRRPSHSLLVALASILVACAGLSLPFQAHARMQCTDMSFGCQQERAAAHTRLMDQMNMDAALAAEQNAQAQANAPPPRATQRLFTVGVVVWYSSPEGVPGVYVAAGEYDESDGIRAAMSNCYHAGGNNCRFGFAFNRGYAAITEAPDGSKFVGTGANKGAARGAANALCRRAQKSCQIKGIYDSTGTDFYVP